MQLTLQLYAKILRSTDAKAMEAQNLSEEDTKAGKGRAQVMNLLTIDTNTVASMATYVWGISNGLIRREFENRLSKLTLSCHWSLVPVRHAGCQCRCWSPLCPPYRAALCMDLEEDLR